MKNFKKFKERYHQKKYFFSRIHFFFISCPILVGFSILYFKLAIQTFVSQHGRFFSKMRTKKVLEGGSPRLAGVGPDTKLFFNVNVLGIIFAPCVGFTRHPILYRLYNVIKRVELLRFFSTSFFFYRNIFNKKILKIFFPKIL